VRHRLFFREKARRVAIDVSSGLDSHDTHTSVRQRRDELEQRAGAPSEPCRTAGGHCGLRRTVSVW
jgi:hypothetical protein